MADISRWPSRLDRRRNLDGLCRGAVRRRFAHRARFADPARRRLRIDDRGRRIGAHPALPDPGFLDRDGARRGRRRDRARGDLLDPPPLHGYAMAAGRVPDRGRRHAGVSRGHPDRQRVSGSEVMSDFLLAHLSDPHLGPLPSPRLGELMGKRAIGYFNWTRNRIGRHAPHVLDAIVADIKAQQPQHVAVTGDLVNIALPQEFAMARSWLHTVGPPHDVTLVPGNHDAYVPATRNMFLRAWADYLTADGASSVTFPFLRRRGPLAL